MGAISIASASDTMRWPRPPSEASVSLPMIDKQSDGEAHPQAGENHRQCRRQQDEAEQMVVRRPHGARRGDVEAIDAGKAGDGVERDRKEADGRADRDLGGRAEAEEQHEQRQEQDDGDRIDAGEQRLEHLGQVGRAADEIAGGEAAGDRNGKRRRQLAQRDLEIVDIFARPQDLDEIVEHRDRIGQQQPVHAPPGRGEIPHEDQAGEERRLHETAEPGIAGSRRHHSGPDGAGADARPDCSTALRISSCSRP